ncbi:MAG: hypothetical protein ABIR77_02940 [Sphingomicrobium sp.]
MRRVYSVVAGLGLALSTTPAPAAWQRAASKHFIIYADERPDELHTFAERLERFDQAVRNVRDMTDPPIGDGNRLTIFVVPDVQAVRRLYPTGGPNVAGFYSGRATGSIAVVPHAAGSDRPGTISPEVVFFHEYAHHLMLANLDTPYPEWLVEGFAEFMSTARLERDGGVGIGAAPQFRAFGLRRGTPIKAERLLAGNFARFDGPDRDVAYGRSWLLTHYLNFSAPRKGQLETYLAALARGTDSLTAARSAFGDLTLLDRDLDKYLGQSRISYIKVAPAAFKPSAIDLAPLSPGAAVLMPDLMPLRIRPQRPDIASLAERVRTVARRFPGDPMVERTLAEAELAVGQDDAALAAADRALVAAPRDGGAMILKGHALLAGKAPDRFSAARRSFMAANALDNEDPQPLLYFYRSYLNEGRRPTDNAIAALHYASDLAPQDMGLRLNSGAQYLRDGKSAEARRTLVPVAYNPHGGNASMIARSLIERIDANDVPGALKAFAAPRPPSQE